MNAIQLLEIIKNGNRLKRDEFQHLIKLHELFPYFQIPKVLLAKYEYVLSEGTSQEMLHWAAVTSPNRSWLKTMIESEQPFEKLEAQLTVSLTLLQEAQASDKPLKLIDDLDGILIPEPKKETDLKERAEVLKKLGENLLQTREQAEQAEKESKLAQAQQIEDKKSKRKANSEDLIETIRKKEKREIVDEKKKEQIDIIKAFSKKEFKLATIKELENLQKQSDLSENSTQLHPTLISESYARILIKQGKKSKAKEIYQKMMVKFPDKSAYFADLIKTLED